MSKMWSGRFNKEASSLLEVFNASIMYDKKMYQEDIDGSIAHSKMLALQSIISLDEQILIENGLKQIYQEIKNDKFDFNIKDEDIHMSIEKRLTSIIGDIGKKLHTSRSRNDQVALDFRLFVIKANKKISNSILSLMNVLLDLSKEHTDTLMPGMTHLQHAQPINFSFHLLAYVSMFKRDYERFESSIKRNNYSPLGCAALAGSPYNIDRNFVAKELGFDGISLNCLDTVSDRDFALEILFNISMLFMHISRLSEELVLWSSYEFKFITISDDYSTGSSIMPQKKNPDVPELLRGKSGRVYGNLMSLLTVMKSLPLAYNKDTQEDKEGVFDSVDTTYISLDILSAVLQNIQVHKDNMKKACEIGHLSATDMADYLVKNCDIPFRDAHFITGKAVALADSKNIDLSHMTFEDLKSIDNRIKPDILDVLNIKNSMNDRNSDGGTSTIKTKEQIDFFEKWIEDNSIA
jgi:argininosuccinate lyase